MRVLGPLPVTLLLLGGVAAAGCVDLEPYLTMGPWGPHTPSTLIVRTDDGSKEDQIWVDYSDDWAAKTLRVPGSPEQVSAIRKATLWVYGYASPGHCEGPAAELDVRYNDARVRFDPCELWLGDDFSWNRVVLTPSGLVPGENRFLFVDPSTPWDNREIVIGIDTETDLGDSEFSEYTPSYTEKNGELMVYLSLAY